MRRLIKTKPQTIVFVLSIAILTWSDSTIAQTSTYLRLNQIGFEPNYPKIAIAFSNEALPYSFNLKDVSTQTVVFTAKPNPVAGAWGQFKNHVELNFTSF